MIFWIMHPNRFSWLGFNITFSNKLKPKTFKSLTFNELDQFIFIIFQTNLNLIKSRSSSENAN